MTTITRLLDKKILGAGWGTLTSYTIGHKSGADPERIVVREVYDHGNAAAVLLVDPGTAMVTLVRQFRLPPHLNGDDGTMVEVCAGLLDGNTPRDCAVRESIEETGIAPKSLAHAFDVYPSPGSLGEKTHCFVGVYDSACRTGPGGGLAHEGEDIEVLEIPFADALVMIRSGEIIDAKTIALLQFAALEDLL